MIELVNGNSVAIPLATGSINLIVTSPPYFGLRKYDAGPGEIGAEPTPADFVEAMRSVALECWRVLRDDGVMVLNLGDSYAANRGYQVPDGKWKDVGNNRGSTVPAGLQPGSRIGIPWRVALALMDDGWTLRQEVIWQKKSPMPESVDGWRWEQHRVKVGKSPRAIGKKGKAYEGVSSPMNARDGVGFRDNSDLYVDCPGCKKCSANGGLILKKGSWRPTTAHEQIFIFVKKMGYFGDREAAKESDEENHTSANPRNVMTFKATHYKGAHYATFPTTLPERFIQAFTPDAGVCSECGAPWARVVNSVSQKRNQLPKDHPDYRPDYYTNGKAGDPQSPGPGQAFVTTTSLGFRPACNHDAPTRPAIVLDPFFGSGSTGVAARKLGRSCVGIDLSLKYLISQARVRLNSDQKKKRKKNE